MKRSGYLTWYEFKKNLERQSGHILLNSDWLQVRPRAPLPWDSSHMNQALLELTRVKKRNCKREGCTMANQAKW